MNIIRRQDTIIERRSQPQASWADAVDFYNSSRPDGGRLPKFCTICASVLEYRTRFFRYKDDTGEARYEVDYFCPCRINVSFIRWLFSATINKHTYGNIGWAVTAEDIFEALKLPLKEIKNVRH